MHRTESCIWRTEVGAHHSVVLLLLAAAPADDVADCGPAYQLEDVSQLRVRTLAAVDLGNSLPEQSQLMANVLSECKAEAKDHLRRTRQLLAPMEILSQSQGLAAMDLLLSSTYLLPQSLHDSASAGW